MGIFGDILGTSWISDLKNSRDKKREAQRAADAAAQLRDNFYRDKVAQQNRFGKIDFNPSYLSDMVGPYKKTKSPEALAYLRSIMSGNNPNMVAPWAAGGTRERVQDSFNRQYGTPEQIAEQRRQADADFGYNVKTPGPIDTTAITVEGSDVAPEEYYRNGGR